jgi:hypothetical protein
MVEEEVGSDVVLVDEVFPVARLSTFAVFYTSVLSRLG